MAGTVEKRDCAVYIKNVCKSYNKATPILQNLCMNVRKGEIYGLLGSSGCGKTTMLSCIVGLESWESGEVVVFGKTPGWKRSLLPRNKLGYMPQDLALYRELTIREIVQFFGQIYNMSNTEITNMWNFLCQLLELPINSTLIGNLSGGEKRRASLALAMIHSPKLLVLDEPTVGVDPLLRRNIWEHLYKLVRSSGTTVLITTHYIEEARLSDTIGIMRNGQMLVEDTPSNILFTFNCHLLEDAVIQLCRKNESKLGIPAAKPASNPNHHLKQIKFKSSSLKKKLALYNPEKRDEENGQLENFGLFKQNVEFDNDKILEDGKGLHGFEGTSSYSGSRSEQALTSGKSRNNYFAKTTQRTLGLTKLKLLTFLRNPLFLGTILFLPTIQAVLSLVTLGSKPTGLHLGIVNKELRNWSTECFLPRHIQNSCDLSYLSCRYLSLLQNGDLLKLDSFDLEEQALAQVDLGNSWGYVVIPDNFSDNSVELAATRPFALNESIVGSRIHAHLDHSAYIQVSLIIKHLYLSYVGFIENVSKSCDFDIQLGDIPLHFRPPVYGTYEDEFEAFIVPGVMALSLFLTASIITGVSHVSERSDGTLTRAKSAGLATVDIICSHLITQALVAVIQLIIWNGVLHFVFQFVIIGSPWLLILFGFLVEMVGAVIGLFLGQIFENETQVFLVGMFLYPFFAFFGCMYLPVNLMDKFWQRFTNIIPTYLPTEAMRSIVIRGVGISHFTVWLGLVSTLVWIGALIIFAVIALNVMRK